MPREMEVRVAIVSGQRAARAARATRGDCSAACLHLYVLETMVQAVVEPQRVEAGSAGSQKWRKEAISNTRVEGGAGGCRDRVYQLRDVQS